MVLSEAQLFPALCTFKGCRCAVVPSDLPKWCTTVPSRTALDLFGGRHFLHSAELEGILFNRVPLLRWAPGLLSVGRSYLLGGNFNAKRPDDEGK